MSEELPHCQAALVFSKQYKEEVCVTSVHICCEPVTRTRSIACTHAVAYDCMRLFCVIAWLLYDCMRWINALDHTAITHSHTTTKKKFTPEKEHGVSLLYYYYYYYYLRLLSRRWVHTKYQQVKNVIEGFAFMSKVVQYLRFICHKIPEVRLQ